MVDGFSSTSHILADEEVQLVDSSGTADGGGGGLRPYMANFLLAVSGLLGSALCRQLAPANFDLLLGVLATEVANRLYKALFKCSFNKVRRGVVFVVKLILSYLFSLSSLAAFSLTARCAP